MSGYLIIKCFVIVDVAMRHSLGAASLQAALDVSNLCEVVALETLAHVTGVI